MNSEPLSEPGRTANVTRRWVTWLRGPGISVLWVISFALLIAFCVWIWNDRQFMVPAYRKFAGQANPEKVPMLHGWLAFKVMASVATVSFLGIVLGLLVGSPRHRGLRSWLLLIALAAGWLGLATGWRDIKWTSRLREVGRRVDVFEEIAAPLRKDWPAEDGASPAFGPFSAYPIGNSRTIMLLTTPPTFEKRGWGFMVIERSIAGGLRFNLWEANARSEWLEWHPNGELPASFVGGLETPYELERASSLGDGWFLVRYR